MNRDRYDQATRLGVSDREGEAHRHVNENLVVTVDEREQERADRKRDPEPETGAQVAEQDVTEENLFHDWSKQDDRERHDRDEPDDIRDLLGVLGAHDVT